MRRIMPDEAGPGGRDFRVLKELGDCHVALANFDRAQECYTQAAELAPRETGPYVGLGMLCLQTHRLGEAEQAFQAALRLDERCGEALGGLAMVYQHRRDWERAFDMYLRCLEADTDNLVALLGLFQTSCQMGTFGKIIHYLQVYLRRHPADASVLFCLATLQAREGQLDQARQSLRAVLAIEPDKPEARQLLREVEAACSGHPNRDESRLGTPPRRPAEGAA